MAVILTDRRHQCVIWDLSYRRGDFPVTPEWVMWFTTTRVGPGFANRSEDTEYE